MAYFYYNFQQRLRLLCGVLFIALHVATADPPVLLWQHVIEGGGTLGGDSLGVTRGNGVTVADVVVVVSNDADSSSSIWLTTNDGSVRILKPQNMNSIVEELRYDPEPLAPDRRVECRSSITLSPNTNDGSSRVHQQYGVYAVIDQPLSQGDNITSRVIAVNPSGTKRWEATVEGIAVGTPQVGGQGQMVYITHNTWSETFQGYMRGRLSVFRNDFNGMGGEVPMNGAGAMGFADKDAPFGPVSVVTKSDGTDHVYWGEAWDEGRASYGLLYEFDSATFHLTGLAPTSWSTITAPTLSADGSSMWLGGQGSCIHGWPRGHSFADRPAWSVTVDPGAGVTPISTPLAVSADEARVCGSSSETGLFCLNATTGGLLWSDENSGPAYASSIFSADGYFLYSILHKQGRVRKYHAASGRIIADFGCEEITGSGACQLDVEADFALSSDGEYLVYSDVFGRVVALRFAQDIMEPTTSPSFAPTAPTLTPSNIPTVQRTDKPSLTPSNHPTAPPTEAPSIAILLLEPSSEPTTEPLTTAPSTTRPTSAPRDSLSIAPTVDLDLFDVDCDEIFSQTKDTEQPSESSSSSPLETCAIALGIALIAMVLGIALVLAIRKLWQLRRHRALMLPTTTPNDDDETHETVSFSRPVHRFSYVKVTNYYDEDTLPDRLSKSVTK